MLNNVPTSINASSRLVTLRHPNGMDCDVFRKTVNRTAPEEVAGQPTIGGIGVIGSEDEADFSFEELGVSGADDPQARVLFVSQFQGQAGNMMDADDGLNYAEPPVEALIECKLAPDHPDFFIADKDDLITVYPGNGFVLTFQVIGPSSPMNIPPYGRKLLLAPRNDQDTGI